VFLYVNSCARVRLIPDAGRIGFPYPSLNTYVSSYGVPFATAEPGEMLLVSTESVGECIGFAYTT
jgi:hypothetical protein